MEADKQNRHYLAYTAMVAAAGMVSLQVAGMVNFVAAHPWMVWYLLDLSQYSVWRLVIQCPSLEMVNFAEQLMVVVVFAVPLQLVADMVNLDSDRAKVPDAGMVNLRQPDRVNEDLVYLGSWTNYSLILVTAAVCTARRDWGWVM